MPPFPVARSWTWYILAAIDQQHIYLVSSAMPPSLFMPSLVVIFCHLVLFLLSSSSPHTLLFNSRALAPMGSCSPRPRGESSAITPFKQDVHLSIFEKAHLCVQIRRRLPGAKSIARETLQKTNRSSCQGVAPSKG